MKVLRSSSLSERVICSVWFNIQNSIVLSWFSPFFCFKITFYIIFCGRICFVTKKKEIEKSPSSENILEKVKNKISSPFYHRGNISCGNKENSLKAKLIFLQMKPIGQDIMDSENRRVYKLVLTGGKSMLYFVFASQRRKACDFQTEKECSDDIGVEKSETRNHAKFIVNFLAFSSCWIMRIFLEFFSSLGLLRQATVKRFFLVFSQCFDKKIWVMLSARMVSRSVYSFHARSIFIFMSQRSHWWFQRRFIDLWAIHSNFTFSII